MATPSGDDLPPELEPLRPLYRLPAWTRPYAWRADTGYQHDRTTTAGDVVRFEEEEHYNHLGVPSDVLAVLDRIPAHHNLVWVTRRRVDAARYGKPERIDTSLGGRIVATDPDGGYLVLWGAPAKYACYVCDHARAELHVPPKRSQGHRRGGA